MLENCDHNPVSERSLSQEPSIRPRELTTDHDTCDALTTHFHRGIFCCLIASVRRALGSLYGQGGLQAATKHHRYAVKTVLCMCVYGYFLNVEFCMYLHLDIHTSSNRGGVE